MLGGRICSAVLVLKLLPLDSVQMVVGKEGKDATSAVSVYGRSSGLGYFDFGQRQK